jgi:hypothetical protein
MASAQTLVLPVNIRLGLANRKGLSYRHAFAQPLAA